MRLFPCCAVYIAAVLGHFKPSLPLLTVVMTCKLGHMMGRNRERDNLAQNDYYKDNLCIIWSLFGPKVPSSAPDVAWEDNQ